MIERCRHALWMTICTAWIPLKSIESALQDMYFQIQIKAGYTLLQINDRSTHYSTIVYLQPGKKQVIDYTFTKELPRQDNGDHAPRFHIEVMQAGIQTKKGGKLFLRLKIKIHLDEVIDFQGRPTHRVGKDDRAISECFEEGLRLIQLFPYPDQTPKPKPS